MERLYLAIDASHDALRLKALALIDLVISFYVKWLSQVNGCIVRPECLSKHAPRARSLSLDYHRRVLILIEISALVYVQYN